MLSFVVSVHVFYVLLYFLIFFNFFMKYCGQLFILYLRTVFIKKKTKKKKNSWALTCIELQGNSVPPLPCCQCCNHATLPVAIESYHMLVFVDWTPKQEAEDSKIV